VGAYSPDLPAGLTGPASKGGRERKGREEEEREEYRNTHFALQK